VFVRVEAPQDIGSPQSLALRVRPADGSAPIPKSVDRAVSLPTSFTITADNRTGSYLIELDALGAGGGAATLLGQGEAAVNLFANKRVDVTLRVSPANSVLSSTTDRDQVQSRDSSARQVAADGNGKLIAVWEGDGCAPNQPCAVFLRALDSDGKHRDGGAPLRLDNASSPAVASNSNGATVVVWRATGADVIQAQRVDPNGALAGGIVAVSDTGRGAIQPDVGVLADGGFVVAWSQNGASGRDIAYRFFSPDAAPLGAVGIANSSPGGPTRRDPSVAVATPVGAPLSVLIAWTELGGSVDPATRGDIRARRFNAQGSPIDASGNPAPTTSDLQLAQPELLTRAARTADTAALPDGSFVVTWEDILPAGGLDSEGSAVVMRRLSPNGTALGEEVIVNATTPRDQRAPAAATSLDGKYLYIAWTDCSALVAGASSGTGCDVRGRAYPLLARNNGLLVGLPAGLDELVNTTRDGDQTQPSIAAAGRGGMLVAFNDASGAGQPAGVDVRVRPIYPTVERAVGLVGSTCSVDAPNCADGLRCLPLSDGVSRCTRSCTFSGPLPRCPDGPGCEMNGATTGMTAACIAIASPG
jgi:hypothetical protein